MFIANFNDAVFIAKLIDFAIFIGAIVWVYTKWAKPLLIAHQQKQNKIVEDAQAYRARTEASVSVACAAIEQAKTDASRMVEVAEAQAGRLIEVERSQAKQHAQRILTHASGELERERYRVRRELLEETVERAHRRAQELARNEIDAAKQQTLVERLIDHLERTRV